MRYFWILIFLLIFQIETSAQQASKLNCRFQNLFLAGDMKTWKTVVDSLRRQSLDRESQLVLLHAEYGLIGNLLGLDQKEAAKREITLFEARLEKALKQNPNNGTLHALNGALVGFRIGLQPLKAPFLGKENASAVDRAIRVSPNDALPWVERGNSLYFRPAAVGGNKTEAIKYYEKAFSIYKKQGGCNWMYFNMGAWLGQVYAKQGDKAKAEAQYRQMLKEAPHFDWVKNELLPQLLKK